MVKKEKAAKTTANQIGRTKMDAQQFDHLVGQLEFCESQGDVGDLVEKMLSGYHIKDHASESFLETANRIRNDNPDVAGFLDKAEIRWFELEGCYPPEEPEIDDRVNCRKCGCIIEDAEHDDNGGYCYDCAAEVE